ncbi:hypothetical protein HN51_000830 [Arachis hypogaea]|uniref:Aspartyl protease family protein 1 n=2 Tax=Arachis TaxID=3817 RepID=A0A6P4CHB4_ARADU|nr:aspartyl protease family protein 1 [Arachis duranensis]XP_025695318.1 aspartyl protease family protein 1 [Arachis hypogaea]XP_052114516.1 aspartyl protease family protein 1 [Arachis duranensis]QHO48821.1 Eukaryotic aspartyl protease family protein [Arachis hypogaea]RYR79056.1 hypothetical protein Ahy_A01g003924 [Arachis hypogaea]
MGSSSKLLFLSMTMLSLLLSRCHGYTTFGFSIHHRFSDQVKGILGTQGLPQIGTPQYYAAMAHRDRLFHGRRLAAGDRKPPLTFAAGNDTVDIPAFGSLHFANVSVGTPPLWFLVALDTGSDLFWVPCNCSSCVRGIETQNGKIDFNIYDIDQSSTSKKVLCNSSLCGEQKQCSSSSSSCQYQVDYLSADTSSKGFLVEDVLHLITDDDQTKDANARITLGCGQIETGTFLNGAAPNGLFGLGMENMSVPSVLAKQGLTSNSFSMCFGSDGFGKITFGDSGSSDQGKTPFTVGASHPTYNITITQIILGGNAADVEFYAIFDSGTSYTYLNDPAYSQIAEKFDSLMKAPRHSSQSTSDLPFEYCYDTSPNQSVEVPELNLTMKGGDDYPVMEPTITVSNGIAEMICLAIVKSNTVNIIGQNFMTGYRIVFDRDNMNLGWKQSNCYDDVLTSTLPANKSHSPAISPAEAANPTVTSDPLRNSGKLSPSRSSRIKPIFALMIVLFLL